MDALVVDGPLVDILGVVALSIEVLVDGVEALLFDVPVVNVLLLDVLVVDMLVEFVEALLVEVLVLMKLADVLVVDVFVG